MNTVLRAVLNGGPRLLDAMFSPHVRTLGGIIAADPAEYVTEPVHDGDVTAWIVKQTDGPGRYLVSVGTDDEGSTFLDCTCPHGQHNPGASRCKHVAACLTKYVNDARRQAWAGQESTPGDDGHWKPSTAE